MQRRRGRRRRRRKRGQSLADRAQQVQRKKEQKTNREKAPKTTLPYPIQDREDSPSGSSSSEDKAFADRTTDRARNSGDDELAGASQSDSTSQIERDAPRDRHKHRPNVGSAQNSQHTIQDREDHDSSSEDKEFADRASSRIQDSGDVEEADQGDSTSQIEHDAPRERHKHRPDLASSGQQWSDSKGGQSELEDSEDDDDGPQMVSSSPSITDNTRIKIRWRCAYPGENVQTTVIPESISVKQQTSFSPANPAPISVQKTKSWLKGWSAKWGGFGRKGNDDNDGNRRAAEQSKGGSNGGESKGEGEAKGGGGPQLVSPSAVEEKLYILPEDHDLCKDMKFICPAICADRPDFVCRESFTCKYPAPPSMIVTRPAEEEEERPSGQKRLPPLPIDTNSGSGKGKGGYVPTHRTQAVGGKGGSSSDDFNTYKKHRDGRPRNLVGGDADTEKDSFDANNDLAENEGRDLDDSFDDAIRDLQGSSKGTANPHPTSTPVGPQLINVDVKPICTSTNHQILPDDYYICSHLEPPPEPECPEELPENNKDYDTLVDKLPNRCKELEDPDFAPPAPDLSPLKAKNDEYNAYEDPLVTGNIIGEFYFSVFRSFARTCIPCEILTFQRPFNSFYSFVICLWMKANDNGDIVSITMITIPSGIDGVLTDITPEVGTISATFPSGGTLTIDSVTGKMEYNASAVIANTPAGDTFVETFTYRVVDTNGQTAMASVAITINGDDRPPGLPQFISSPPPGPTATGDPTKATTISPSSRPSSMPSIEPINAPPIAEDNSYTRTVDQLNAGGGTIIGQILENDSDPDGEVGDLTITSITPDGGANTPVQPAVGIDYNLENGIFRINPVSGVIVYTPDPDKVAALGPGSEITDSFTYVITDKDGGTDAATVMFTVVGQNDPPVPEDDSETVPEGDDVSDCVL